MDIPAENQLLKMLTAFCEPRHCKDCVFTSYMKKETTRCPIAVSMEHLEKKMNISFRGEIVYRKR